MKPTNQFVALLLAGALLMAGCSQTPAGGLSSSEAAQPVPASLEVSSAESSSKADSAPPPTVLGELGELGSDKGNWLNLTTEQMLEDADYLYQTLSDNFPYFDVIQRKIGVDMEAEYLVCLKEIEACETDGQFYTALDSWIRKADGLGHLMLFQPGMYAPTAQGYKEDALRGYKDELDRQRMADVYNDEKAKVCYEGLAKVLEPLFERVNAYYAALEPGEEEAAKPKHEWKNIETEILEPSKIAYIAVNSLDGTSYDEDKQVLFDFYAQVKDYDHVIFDFTQNGGGSMNYFDDLIAAPNTDKTLKANDYMFLMGGDYNLSFFDTANWKSPSALPPLLRMNAGDLAKFDFYADVPFVVEPAGKKQLNGKLWMLVGPNVFSSSEYAAMLCKSTGFMTLVGTTTGGDGIGYDPLPLVLPNSGLVVRYSAIYGATDDGAGSQEYGTTPDIISPEGENPLDTCLKAIAALS